MPTRHEVAERDDARVLRQHPKGADREYIRAGEPAWHAFVVSFRRVARNHLSVAAAILHETEGPSRASTSHPTKKLVGDDWPPTLLVDFQVIRDERGPGPFAVLELDDQGTVGLPAAQFAKAPPPIPCPADSVRKALRKESKDVKDRRFSAAVRTKQNRQRRQVGQQDISQTAVVLHLE